MGEVDTEVVGRMKMCWLYRKVLIILTNWVYRKGKKGQYL